MNASRPDDVPYELPAGISGTANPRFRRAVKMFARIFTGSRSGGGALAVYQHEMPIVDIWAGTSDEDGTRAWSADTGALVYSATKGIASTVAHRLADRGLIDYDAPVAQYWTEFAAHDKRRITVRQLLTHSAGLSSLAPIARSVDEVLDHRLMEERLAAAAPDHLVGTPAYHSLTYGWLVAGLARSVTGLGMADLFRREVAAPLGIDGIYLGTPPGDATTMLAAIVGTRLDVVGRPMGARVVSSGRRIPGPAAALARSVFLPGIESILAGTQPPILRAEWGSSSGVFTASALGKVYSAIANGGTTGGHRLLSPQTTNALAQVQTHKLDRTLFLPLAWRLGYHGIPMIGAPHAFGHVGLGGSFGWADPNTGLAVAFVHNRLSASRLPFDQSLIALLLPPVVRGARGKSGSGSLLPMRRAS